MQQFARQAIQTKYHGPTDSRGSRITARCEAKRITVSWNHECDVFENHRRAALKLALDLKWVTDGDGLIGGAPPGSAGYVFVIVDGKVSK